MWTGGTLIREASACCNPAGLDLRRAQSMNDTHIRQLMALAEDEASGDFVCESNGLEVHVFLQAGRVAWASDSQHPRAFLRYLREQEKIDDDALEQVISECRQSHAPLGETMLAWKLATPEQVRAALRHQIGLALATLERSSSAKAMFLSRPHYTRCNADFTFELRKLLASPLQEPLGSGSAAANGVAVREVEARPPAPPPGSAPPAVEPAPPASLEPAVDAASSSRKPLRSGLARALRSPHALAPLAGLVVASALVAAFALNRRSDQAAPGASAAPSGAGSSPRRTATATPASRASPS
jgi:hypothetical protein